MAQASEATMQPPPLRLSRVFHARRETVFKAWSSADHVRRWFSPQTFTVADAKVEMRVGGAFDVCMRSPMGTEHWTRGRFVEVTPHSRLVIDMHATDSTGKPLFRAYTEVDFADAHLHRGVRHGEGRRAEPAFYVFGGTPGAEHGLAPGRENPGQPERRRLHGRIGFRVSRLRHCRVLRFPGFSGSRPAGRAGVPTRPAAR